MAYNHAIPVLPSPDVQKSVDFYTEKLGFDRNFLWQDDPDQPVIYGGVQDGDVHIHFVLTEDESVCHQTICRIYCDDIDAAYARAKSHGIVHPNGPLGDRPWGEREFSILDCFGICVHFAQELS